MPSARAALAELRAGLERAAHLVEQLLTLAREEPGVSRAAFRAGGPGRARAAASSSSSRRSPRGTVSISECPTADAPVDAPVSSAGTPQGLRALVSNLVDNAVRHTPAGGRVDVAVQQRRRRSPAHGPRFRPGHSAGRARARVRSVLSRAGRRARRGRREAVSASRSSSASPSATARRSRLAQGLSGPQGEGLGVSVRMPQGTAVSGTRPIPSRGHSTVIAIGMSISSRRARSVSRGRRCQ